MSICFGCEKKCCRGGGGERGGGERGRCDLEDVIVFCDGCGEPYCGECVDTHLVRDDDVDNYPNGYYECRSNCYHTPSSDDE